MRELARRATVIAALDLADDIVLTDAHVEEALDQLLDADNLRTTNLLGTEAATPKLSMAQIQAARRR